VLDARLARNGLLLAWVYTCRSHVVVESNAMSEASAPRHDPAAAKTIPANAENRYTVGHADLPLSCPMPGMSLWNSHPKVYLPIEASGSAKCPYCGAVYTLAD
jgi:uncharacterized Zn-finger protein